MSVFGQVWLWSLAAFVLGALLTWLLLVRPARARVRELERRVVAHRAEQVAVPAEPATDAAPAYEQEEDSVPERAGADYPATELFESVDPQHTEYLPPVDGRTRVDFGPETSPYVGPDTDGSDIDSTLTPDADQAEPAETSYSEPFRTPPEPSRGLFQPALPSTPPQYDPDLEPAHQEPAHQEHAVPDPVGAADAGHDEPAAEGLLPKRQRRESPLGGFDPPEPIQPSMRAMTRREPVQNGHSGSLFEPGMPSGAEPGEEHDAGAESDPGAPVGPFGPGSAMPLPGGAKPSEDFTVKASVTTLRYCPPESERFADMVAEVWFRNAQEAERVGFRPIG